MIALGLSIIADPYGVAIIQGTLFKDKWSFFFSESMNPDDKRWYKYNDDYVSDIQGMDEKNFKNYGSSNAYLLFYAKKILFP